MAGYADGVSVGVNLALEAHRRGLITDAGLEQVLAYYRQEGACAPAEPLLVVGRLGNVETSELAPLLLAPSVGGKPSVSPRAAIPPFEPGGSLGGGRLELRAVLGRGGMGIVYRAFDRVLARDVAVKVMRLPEGDADRASRLQRFSREAQVMARVRHPACIEVHDAGLTERGEPYLVLELVVGASLEAQLHDGRRPDPRTVARWGRELAEGLQACHDVGVVHRDMKPANVLIDAAGRARVADFGIAHDLQQTGERLTRGGGPIGTLHYMSPEQLDGRSPDARSDVYSLGATLYEACSGHPPFSEQHPLLLMQRIATAAPASLRLRRPDVPVDLDRVVLGCLAKSPEERYQTARALALDLARVAAGEPVHGPTTTGPPPAAERRGRAASPNHRAALVGLALTVSVVAVASLARSRPAADASPGAAHPAGVTTGANMLDSGTSGTAPGAAVASTVRGPAAATGPVPAPGPVAAEASPSPPARSRVIARGPDLVNERDGSTLVWVPPGSFVMGSQAEPNERPPRQVTVRRGFYLGKHEVTWGQWRRFCRETRRQALDVTIPHPRAPFTPTDDHPLFFVTVDDARAYCAWAGGRLPTATEWEYAARGPDGRVYPWPDGGVSPGAAVANLVDETAARLASRETQLDMFGPDGQLLNLIAGYDDGHFYPAPVGSFPLGASPFGCLDMAGNVAELVDVDSSATPEHRGGGWRDNPWTARASCRTIPPNMKATDSVGLRLLVESE